MAKEQILLIILIIVVFDFALEKFLGYLNIKSSKGKIPDEFKDFEDELKNILDKETLEVRWLKENYSITINILEKIKSWVENMKPRVSFPGWNMVMFFWEKSCSCLLLMHE